MDRKEKKTTNVCTDVPSSLHLMKEICEYRFVNVQHVSSTCTLVLYSIHNDIYVKIVDEGEEKKICWQT